MKVKKIIKILEDEIDKTSGEWVEIYEEKKLFENIIALLKEKEGRQKGKIYKTEPKGSDYYTVTHYSIPQGKDGKGNNKEWKERKLKIGDKYYIETNEPGQELCFIGKFVGWKENTIITNKGERLPENISYLALFEAIGYIEVDTDYSLTITKSEEEGGRKNGIY